eukprot:6193269-Pleurochrysis_carterae.AAC.1
MPKRLLSHLHPSAREQDWNKSTAAAPAATPANNDVGCIVATAIVSRRAGGVYLKLQPMLLSAAGSCEYVSLCSTFLSSAQADDRAQCTQWAKRSTQRQYLPADVRCAPVAAAAARPTPQGGTGPRPSLRCRLAVLHRVPGRRVAARLDATAEPTTTSMLRTVRRLGRH